MTARASVLGEHLRRELGAGLYGLDEAIHFLSIALIARGHVLLEGPPGLGKTLLTKTFAGVLGRSFKRIQGTADLMPTDITGVHVFNAQSGAFEFQPGPLFADVVLVDEINRAGPKTQSALLEAMEEQQVTIDRDTFPLSEDFLVVATQNPREFEGTYPLPESQLDRFMISIPLGYPDRENEARVVEAYNLPDSQRRRPAREAADAFSAAALQTVRAQLHDIVLSPALIGYILDIAIASREHSSVNLGLSSRGAVVLARCARVAAAIRGGDYVVPDDVKHVAAGVMRHRLVLSPEAALEGSTTGQVLETILENVPVPR